VTPPIALVFVPDWGNTRAAVVEIDGERWTLRSSSGRARHLTAADVRLDYLVPLPVGLVAHHPAGHGVRRLPPPDAVTQSWRDERRTAILRAADMRWRVHAADNPSADD